MYKKLWNFKDSFDKAKHWINELFENASSDILILMVGNKADLEDNRNVDTNVKS